MTKPLRHLLPTLLWLLLSFGSSWALAQGQWTRVYHQSQHATKNFDLDAVAYGAGRFVAVGAGNNRTTGGNYQMVIMASADGVAWSDVTPSHTLNSSYLFDVVYTGTQFVAVGNDTTQATSYNYETLVMVSSDGISWAQVAHSGLPLYQFWADITYRADSGRFVLARDTRLYTSTNLTQWQEITLPSGTSGAYWQDLTYGNGQFLAVGKVGVYGADYLLRSTDGLNWSLSRQSVGRDTMAYLNNKFFSLGSGDAIRTSSDGTTWTDVTPKFTFYPTHTVDYANGVYVFGGGAVETGHTSGYIGVTSDFKTWWAEKLNSEVNGGIKSIAHDSNGFVAIADDGLIFHSPFSSTASAPVVTSTTTLAGSAGSVINYTATASNLGAGTYSYALWNLNPTNGYNTWPPQGLTFSTSTGVLSGTLSTSTSAAMRLWIAAQDLSIVGSRQIEFEVQFSAGASPGNTTESCDSGHLSACTDSHYCGQYGGYWYAATSQCYDSSPCLAGYPTYCGYESWCAQAGYYWYNNQCNTSAQPTATCTSTTLSLCTSMDACTSAQGYWNFDWCGATPQSNSDHFETYCQQGYTQYCANTGSTISDWIPRTDIAYQSVATTLDNASGYRLNGGVWSNSRPNAAGQYDGNGVQSSTQFNFVGKTTYGSFTVHGAGQYASWYFKPWYLPGHHLNSHHSYASGLLIPDDTRIYATFEIAANGQWSSILASGNYAHLGGTTLHRESGTLTSTQLGQLADSPFLAAFGDNYAGTSAYMVIHEVRVGDVVASASTSATECLFNWAERNYPSYLSPAGATSATLAEYYYRYYATSQSYLATKSDDAHLYYLGPLSGNRVTDLGAVATWLSQAGCGQ